MFTCIYEENPLCSPNLLPCGGPASDTCMVNNLDATTKGVKFIGRIRFCIIGPSGKFFT